jgi:hypothetical protein
MEIKNDNMRENRKYSNNSIGITMNGENRINQENREKNIERSWIFVGFAAASLAALCNCGS